jgi:hypothetical protein
MFLETLLLITQLGAPSFRDREVAQAELVRRGDGALLCLLAGEQSKDFEVAGRCRALVNDYYRRHGDELAEHYKPAGWQSWPPIYMLIGADWPGANDIYSEYWARSWKVFREWDQDDQRQNEATRLLVADVCASRRSPVELLTFMCTTCRHWREERGEEVPPAYQPRGVIDE